MFKKIVVLATIGTAALVVGMTKPAEADEPNDWVLENCVDASGKPTTKIDSGVQCDLKNRKSGKCLVQTSHMGQVDWDFASCSSKPRNAKIVAKDGNGAVTCGETVALKLGTEYYRKCVNPQKVGIDVCSEKANAPEQRHFDWQLKSCNGALQPSKPFSLFNASKNDSIVQASRPSKIVDTCWENDMKYGRCVAR